jgi:2-keto-4-pentenoate hydratase
MKKSVKTKYIGCSLFTLVALFLFPFAAAASAEDAAARLAEQFLKKTPVTAIEPGMTMEQALKIQEKFVTCLIKEFGAPTGFKAGLTNPGAQKAFGIMQPVRGTMLEKMFLKNKATLGKNSGIKIFAEGDLVVRVGSDAINGAKTTREALAALDAVVPFMELPDVPFVAGFKMDGPALVAVNVAARYGVLGDPVSLTPSPEWMDRLKNFTLQLYDDKGALFSEGKGSALLGDPLNVVLWIRNSLTAEGKKLKKGDLLSLGSITKMMPTKPGTTIKAKFIDLDPKGPVELTVSFE